MKTLKIMYTKKSIGLLLAFLIVSLHLNAQETLDQYVQEALDNNPQIKATHTQYEAAMQKAPQVNSLADLELSAGYFISPVETRVGPQQARLGIRQMLPWFGVLDAKEDAAVQQAKSHYEQYLNTRQRVIYQVKRKWYRLYKIQASIRIIQEHLQILEQYQSVSTVKFETGHKSGKSGMVDVLRVDMDKEDLKNRLRLLEDDQEATETAFNVLLNKDEAAPVDVTDSLGANPLPLAVRELMDSMLLRHPSLNALNHKEKAWQATGQAARKEGAPSIGVGFDYIMVGTPANGATGEGGPAPGKDAMFPMVTVKLPIYRGKYRAKVLEASLQQEAVRQTFVSRQNQLKTMFAEAYKDYKDAVRKIDHYQAQVEKSQQAVDILMTNYQTAGQEFEEVLRMERRLLDYQLKLEKAYAAQHIAVANLEYLYGKTF